MKIPIIISDPNDVMVFDSIDYAQCYLESWGLEDLRGYDAEGRLLRITPWGIINCGIAKIELAEKEPNHVDELRKVLINFFALVEKTNKNDLEQLPLKGLIEKSLKYAMCNLFQVMKFPPYL